MTNELMLLGFATLILLGFQRNIVKICSEMPCRCIICVLVDHG